MITMEKWVTIKNLKKSNPSMGTRKIAELVGVSRNTVKKVFHTYFPFECFNKIFFIF